MKYVKTLNYCIIAAADLKLAGGYSEAFSEACAEILGVGEAYGIGNFADRIELCCEHFLGTVESHNVDVVVDRLARETAYLVVGRRAAHAEVAAEIRYGIELVGEVKFYQVVHSFHELLVEVGVELRRFGRSEEHTSELQSPR